MAASTNRLLKNIDFPVFIVEFLGPKHFVVGGGGGASATGVPNGLEIIELSSDEHKTLEAKSVHRFDSGKYAVMNCGLHVDGPRMYLACGHDNKCFIYTIQQKIVTPRPNSPDGQLRKRKSGLTKADDFKHAKKIISFEVQETGQIETDFHKDDAYQNCSVFSADGLRLVTGGADGCVRLWRYPELSKVWETKAHSQEIDCIHIDPLGKQICSTSKDGQLLLWNVEDGTRIAELKWASTPSIKYKHKACRYCMLDEDPKKICLFSIEVPVVNKKGTACYISQWNVNRHIPVFVQSVHTNGSLACMDISHCGKFLAVGTMEGEVAVYSTSNLKQIYYVKNGHKTFVTGLAFAPSSTAGQLVSGNSGFTLLSISIDNQLKLHQSPKPSWKRFKLLLLLLLLLLCTILTVFAAGSLTHTRDT